MHPSKGNVKVNVCSHEGCCTQRLALLHRAGHLKAQDTICTMNYFSFSYSLPPASFILMIMKLWIRYYMSTWGMSWVPLHLSPNTGPIASAHIYRLGCIPSTTTHKDRTERLEADKKHTDVIYVPCHAVESENTGKAKQHSSHWSNLFSFFRFSERDRFLDYLKVNSWHHFWRDARSLSFVSIFSTI